LNENLETQQEETPFLTIDSLRPSSGCHYNKQIPVLSSFASYFVVLHSKLTSLLGGVEIGEDNNCNRKRKIKTKKEKGGEKNDYSTRFNFISRQRECIRLSRETDHKIQVKDCGNKKASGKDRRAFSLSLPEE
jgi:hypothetical protein